MIIYKVRDRPITIYPSDAVPKPGAVGAVSILMANCPLIGYCLRRRDHLRQLEAERCRRRGLRGGLQNGDPGLRECRHWRKPLGRGRRGGS